LMLKTGPTASISTSTMCSMPSLSPPRMVSVAARISVSDGRSSPNSPSTSVPPKPSMQNHGRPLTIAHKPAQIFISSSVPNSKKGAQKVLLFFELCKFNYSNSIIYFEYHSTFAPITEYVSPFRIISTCPLRSTFCASTFVRMFTTPVGVPGSFGSITFTFTRNSV